MTMADGPARTSQFPLRATVATVALGAVAFAPGVMDMVGRWMAPGDYYGHGPLVPLVSGWALWRERERLRAIPRGSSAVGLGLVAVAVLVLMGSVLEDIHFTQNAALLLAIAGASLALYGVAAVRAAWFPLLYLGFMVPIPQMWIANITFRLKILAAKMAVGAIELSGTPVVLDGSTIHLPQVSVTVEDVCSGLRTLVALLAIAAIFAYLDRSRRRAILTILLAGPIAIVANVARILVLCALESYGVAAPPGSFLHEATGLAIYATALGLLSAIRALPFEEEPEWQAPAVPPDPPHRPPGALRVAVLLVMLGAGAAVSVLFGFNPATRVKTTRTRDIPQSIGAWIGKDIVVEPRVFELLETEDIIIRRFANPAERTTVDLYVVHAADSRKVAHPPEICFSGGGYEIRERAVASLPAAGGGKIPAIRMIVDHGRDTVLVYYWYRLDGRDTADFLDHQLSMLSIQLRRESREGSMIRLSTAVAPGAAGLAEADARIADFAREAMGPVLKAVP